MPQLNAAILQLAQHADRETAMFANMALTFLVQPVANKISLKEAGLLDFLRAASKVRMPARWFSREGQSSKRQPAAKIAQNQFVSPRSHHK